MADVRCPMCGKATPADLEECQHCHARLRPIWESAPTSGAADPDDQASDLPDWLKSLRAPDEPEAQPSESEPEEQGALPDWLGALRKQPGEGGGAPSDELADDLASRSDEGDASWMQEFYVQDDLAGEETFSKQMNDALQPDDAGWLSRIGSTPTEEERPPQPSDTLDWLTELEQAAPDLSPTGDQSWSSRQDSQSLEPAEPLPDWLAQTDADLPEWLGQGETPPASETSDEALFEPPAVAAELPDWLQQASQGVQEATGPVDASIPETEWTKLEPLESAAPQASDEAAVNWLADEEEALPDWLFSEAPPADEPASPAESAVAASMFTEAQSPGEDLTDWSIAEDADLPDWLKPSPEAGEEEEIPSLLFNEEPLPDAAQAPEKEELAAPEEEISPWLAGAEAAAAGVGSPFTVEPAEENLGWLDELESTYSGLSPNVLEEPAVLPGEAERLGLEPGSTLPGWLSEMPGEEGEPALEGDAEDGSELRAAELPSWLQAMRPVGVMTSAADLPGEPELQQIENAGPLAGLRGALPAEPDVSQVQKPPVYSVKLQVTETQQLQAELLRSLVDSEGQPRVLAGRPAIRSQDLIRVVIAVLLIFPLVFTLLTGFPQTGLPAPSLEIETVGRMIDSLPPGAPVLLAVDYQPGFSGEMDAVAAPVVRHLLERGVYLALVSTVSTGPVQAEHLLNQVQSSSGALQPLQANTINLGYIPGGAAGLLAFARSPRQALPTNLSGERAWESAELQAVDSLAEFALVLVATENPDVARYWIEQVQPQLGMTPLVMLMSAQAEPNIWPYYHAYPSQVQGLVGGLAGGAAYLARSGQSGLASRYWSPFNLGIAVAVVLMILGGILHLVMGQMARQKQKAGGEQRP